MRGFTASALWAALALSSIVSAADLQPITIKGNAFFAGDSRFYIRGVDYQPGGSDGPDPLSNSATCKRDIAAMKDLGLNTIRVYTVDNSLDHDDCMQQLADAGIYLILDVNTSKFAINRDFPEDSYNEIYLQHVFATVDVFKGYPNTMAFFAGNEVVNAPNNTAAATVVKAVIRDMREYVSKQSKRSIPVGYSAADVSENRYQMATYLNCGSADERTDFFAFNDYSWCGDSSYQVSGWEAKVANYSDYSVPLFLSEYGCNKVLPRLFTEVESLYSSEMTKVFSGGLVYEFTQEPNKYGLVQVSSDGKSITELTDFKNLKSEYAKTANPSGDGDFQDDLEPSDCPAQSDLWQANNTLPAMPSKASAYMQSGAGKPLGTSGPSNQKIPSGVPGDSTASSSSSSSTSSPSSKGSSAAFNGRSEMATEAFTISCIFGFFSILGAFLVL
jgi:hypothetical protein